MSKPETAPPAAARDVVGAGETSHGSPPVARRGRLPVSGGWLARTATAAVAGLAVWAAFPPRNWWFLAVIGLGLLYAALQTGAPRARTGAWVGFVFGLAFFVPLLPWIGVYVGPLPWLALAVALALYQAVFGVVAVLTMRLPAAPIWFTLSWVLVEALRSMFPFGGFPWGRVAFSQVDGPLLPLASVLGAPGLSAGVALFGSSVVWVITILVRAFRAPHRTPGDATPTTLRTATLAVAIALLAPVSAIALTPASLDRNISTTSARVAAVQGNVPRLGLDFNAQRRAVLDNHVRTTLTYGSAIAGNLSTGRPDFVLWPENASDISPLANPDAAAAITAAAEAVDAPILVGTLLRDTDGRPTNSVLVWTADGPVDRYDKHIIQPFGEYLPWRSFFRHFSSYADLAGNFRPGTGPAVVRVPGRSGEVTVGVATCWEIAFDRAARQSVREGAQILFVPTNNATFGRTEMTYQQLAMSQVRAVEHGRAVVVAATSGVSAIIEPDGAISEQSEIFTSDVLTGRLALHDDTTLATRLGAWPESLAIVVAVGGLLFALLSRTRFSLRARRDAVRTRAVTQPSSGPDARDDAQRAPHQRGARDADAHEDTKELDGLGD